MKNLVYTRALIRGDDMKIRSFIFLVLTFTAHLSAKEIYVPSGDAQLYCKIMGKGDPVLIIHGGPGLSQAYLQPQMEKLSEDAQVIFYDQRGCGKSTGEINPETISLTTYIEDIEVIRKYFGWEKMSLLGHSWGGFLAMQYAILHPQSIRKLILLNTMPASSEDLSLFMQEWTKRTAPYQKELDEIKKSEGYQAGDPSICAKYYHILFRAYCYDPMSAEKLNLGMSRKAWVAMGK